MVFTPRGIAAAALVVSLAIGPSGCAPRTVVPPAPNAPPKAPEARHVYQLDYAIKASDGATTTVSSYSLSLEEGRHSEIRSASNVPLRPSGGANGVVGARQDIGMLLRSTYVLAGNDLLLRGTLETSSMEDGAAIRKVSSNADALVTPGKPTVILRVEDAHVKVAVEVTATKLR